MTVVFEKKAAIGNFASLRAILDGNHTIKQKIAMMLDLKYVLQHDYNIHNAGPMNLYMPLVDPDGRPLTHFADGEEIAQIQARIRSPYHCAADSYQP